MKQLLFLAMLFLACTNPLSPHETLDVELITWTQQEYVSGLYSAVEVYYDVHNLTDKTVRYEVFIDVICSDMVFHGCDADAYNTISPHKCETNVFWIQTADRKAESVKIMDWVLTDVKEQ